MLNSFRHIVITRLNIRPVNLVTGEIVRSSFEDKWMEERISYLQDYCLPSILNQECTNFDWLVYLDSTTKTKYKIIVEEIVKVRGSRSHVEFTDNAVAFLGDLRNRAKILVQDDSKYLLTTRLDSDDALQKNAVLRIQQAFQDNVKSNKTRFAINLLNGYQLRIKPFYELVWKRVLSNPFITMVEKSNDDLETVYTYFHNDLKGIEILDIVDGYYWLQTVHGLNMATDVLGWPVVQLECLKDFGISSNQIKILPHIFLYSLYNRLYAAFDRRFKK